MIRGVHREAQDPHSRSFRTAAQLAPTTVRKAVFALRQALEVGWLPAAQACAISESDVETWLAAQADSTTSGR